MWLVAKHVPHGYDALQGKRATLGAKAPLDRAYATWQSAGHASSSIRLLTRVSQRSESINLQLMTKGLWSIRKVYRKDV
jgi:hypothetical protein